MSSMDEDKKLSLIRKFLPALYLLSIALGCWYVGVRSTQWLGLVLPWHLGWLVTALLVCYFVMCISVGKTYLVARTKAVTYACGVSTFLFMYLFMAVLASDALRLLAGLFVKEPAFRQNLFVGLGFACLAFVLVCTCLAVHKAGALKLVEYAIDCPKLQGDYRLVLLADLHIGYYVGEKHIRKVVEMVNSLQADRVVIAGDLINAGNTHECSELDKVTAQLARLESREGTCAVVGNHDPDVNEPDFRRFLQDSRIKLLEDQVDSNGLVQLVGRTTCTKERLPLAELLRGTDPALPVFVIDHDPIGVRDAVAAKTDLVMCGHTHRGQVFPLNLFVRVLYSKEEFWGLSRVQDTAVLVSAGTGYFSMPMRLGSDCEVICLDVHGSSKETDGPR